MENIWSGILDLPQEPHLEQRKGGAPDTEGGFRHTTRRAGDQRPARTDPARFRGNDGEAYTTDAPSQFARPKAGGEGVCVSVSHDCYNA